MIKFIFWHADKHQRFAQVDVLFWVCIDKLRQRIQNEKFAYLFKIYSKIWSVKLIFCLQMNWWYHLSFWMCISRHLQSTQNNKFSIFFQYLKENVKDKIDLCLQVNIKGLNGQESQNSPKLWLYITSKKSWEWSWFFACG